MHISIKYQQGVTLIELVISMVIISIAVIGILNVMIVTSNSSADPMIEHQAVAIAESYLEEIMPLPFVDETALIGDDSLTAEDGEVRNSYDDVNDYNALPANDNVTDINGDLIPGLANYSVTITVVKDGSLGPAGQLVAAGDAQLVTVTVSHASGVSIALSGYRTRY